MSAQEQFREQQQDTWKSTPVQKMPDFQAALTSYADFLRSKDVAPADIQKTIEGILKVNNTRQSGNNFINFVNLLTRVNKNSE